MKKITIIVILSLCCFTSMLAQDWTKADSTEFAKATELAFAVDMSDATIMGLTKDKFPAYYASKYGSNEKAAEMLLERFCNEMEYQYFTNEVKNVTCNKDAQFKVVYKISYITEHGGFGGYYYVQKGKVKSEQTAFSVKDGKWNSFDNLLMENVKKLFDHRWDQAKKVMNKAFKGAREGLQGAYDSLKGALEK